MRAGLSFSFWLSFSGLCGTSAIVSGCGGKDEGADSASSSDTDQQPADDSGAATDDTGSGTDTGSGDGLLRLTILHTNDWQSHMLGQGPNAEYSPDVTGDDSTMGGLARISTLVTEIRGATDHPVVLYDGGDWMAGALFQLLATTHAAELQVAQMIGFDAMTIGNHEYDWGPQVLGEMITTADARSVTVPLLASNTVPDTTSSDDDALEAHFDSGRIETTRIDVLDNGLTIGLLGILGDDAVDITPMAAPTAFTTAAEGAALAVEELQAQDVDIIIALTHNGVDDTSNSPDETLASDVPGIDVIVGGHSHTPLQEYRTQGDTVIVQAGAYTKYLGQLDLVTDGETWTVENYQLHPIDDTIEGDPAITAMVDEFLVALEEGPLTELGYSFDQPIASIAGDMDTDNCNESGIGNFVVDAYRDQMNAAMDASQDPIDFTFESQGVIRDGMLAGDSGVQGFSDVFRVLPLGVGTDDVPGYALVSFYIPASSVKDACEVTASISPDYGCDYFIQMSGFRCTLDMDRPSFNRARKVEVLDGKGEWEELDTSSSNTELYRVAVDSYVASLMSILADLTYDAIIVTPLDADGNVIKSVDDMLFDADPQIEGVQEMKLWEALVGYAETYEDVDGDGVPDIDESYLADQDRYIGWK